MNRSRYNKLAEAAYDRVAEQADKFDIEDVINEIVAELSSETVNAELIHEFAQTLAAKADDRRASRAESGQMDLLTGEPAALDAVWRLGHGERVTARKAKRGDVLAWLEIRGANAVRVMDAYQLDRQVAAELLVYMPDDDITVEAALEARKHHKP